jgi:hypothetical protein
MARENDFIKSWVPGYELLDLHLRRTEDSLFKVVDDSLGFMR